jgi:putative AlgH/UPF0301 family transcriptional regulator
MSLRKRLLFAMLFATVALAEPGRVHLYKAGSDAPKLNTLLRAPAPATAALPWYRSWTANKPNRGLKAFRRKAELLPASFLPIQFKNPKDLGVGKLLVASRGLGDPHFAGTVILLVHYDESGAVGPILNRRTDVPLSQVLDLKAAKDRSDPVYVGGPVEPSVAIALLQSSAKIEKAENIFGGVYLISDKGLFEKTISGRPDPNVFHVYLGYTGWTQDQLRAEVKMGAWFVFPADTATVFSSDPDSLWLQTIEKTKLQLADTEPFNLQSVEICAARQATISSAVRQFDEFNVSFVSVTQQFNTTSSMGRLTFNVLLSFEQFEREVLRSGTPAVFFISAANYPLVRNDEISIRPSATYTISKAASLQGFTGSSD